MKLNRVQLRKLIIESIGDFYDFYAPLRDEGVTGPLEKYLKDKNLDYYEVEVYSKPEELLYGYPAATDRESDSKGGNPGGVLFIECDTASELPHLKKIVDEFLVKNSLDMHISTVIHSSKNGKHMIIIHSDIGTLTN